MSHQQRQSPKQQLVGFANTFIQATASTAFAFITMAILVIYTVLQFNIVPEIGSLPEMTLLPAYFVATWMSLVLYLTSENLKGEQEPDVDTDEAVEEIEEEDPSDWDELWENAGQIFKGYASMAYLSLIMVTGAILGTAGAIMFSSMLGVILAIAMPAVELRLGEGRFWFLTPSNLFAFPAFALMIPVTIATVLLAVILGTILGLSQALKEFWKEIVKVVVQILATTYVETPALDPFRQTFNRPGRR
ncbi:hypothetical protein [Halobaculum sp. P14]|uniref:hypothetical protein n=1 Tax=Halobaculum sp. P14 TaxID=3421638 RepID=UPI003EBDC970